MNKPYVVSTDIYLLMKEWATQHGFVLPAQEFFRKLREEFSNYMKRVFLHFELVSEEEISCGLAAFVAESGLPAISLDRVYFRGGLNLDITRLVDRYGNDRGLAHRAGMPTLTQQIRELQKSGIREAVLVDDVVFTGALIERIIKLLSRMGIRVPLVYAGIGIAEGMSRVHTNTGSQIYCVRTYEKVIDEVCERDFYPGVPLSGRLLAGGGNIGVPYLLPFGKPENWASIPSEHVAAFSHFCIRQTILLFDEVGRCSGGPVLCRDPGRKVLGLPVDRTPYVDALRKVLGKIL